MRIIDKYKSLSLPMQAAIWFIVVNFFTKGISFITVPLFSGVLSTEEYGKVSIYLTYQGVLINFATFEMYSGAYIRGILRYKEDVSFFTRTEQLLSTFITIAVFIVSIPIMPWLIKKAQIDGITYILMYLYFLFFPAYQCWVGRKRFDYEYKPVVITAIIYTLTSALIPLAAVFMIDATAIVRISFMLLPEALFCFPFFLRNIWIKGFTKRKNEVLEQWKFLLLFQFPSVVHALSYILLSSVDRIMIGEMVGNAEAGIYSIAATLASVISILGMSANQVLKPWRYQRMESKDYESIKSKSSILLIVFGVAILAWILVAPDIMRLFFRADYYPAVWAIPPISISVFFVFLYSMFVDIEEYFYKTKYTMYATTISAIANIVMNYFGIKIWGYIACAYTTLICYFLLAALHLYWSNKAAKKNEISIRKIFDVRFICVLSLIFVGAEVAFTLTYKISIIRYILLAICVVAVVVNYKRIISLIKSIKTK